jgi:hypothetical protein
MEQQARQQRQQKASRHHVAIKLLPVKNLLILTLLALVWIAPPSRAELPDPARFSAVIELGDLRQAQAWLDAGLDPDFEGSLIGTGLMIGAWEGNIALMELFLARGASIDRTNRFGETALMLAAWKNRLDAVRWLLAHGARPDPPQERAWTALHYAVFAGHREIVEELLAAGANVNARSTNGSTVVMMAAREGHLALAQRLLAAGANPTLKNDYGDDALSWAMRQGNYDIARAITSAENFAALSRAAAAAPAPPPIRSLPAPDRVDELLRKARLAELEGKREEALLAYRAAWDELKAIQPPQKIGAPAASGGKPPAASAGPAKTPKALVIRARRKEPEKQSLSVSYAESDAADLDALLARARSLADAGQREAALALYRRAAAAIRASSGESNR